MVSYLLLKKNESPNEKRKTTTNHVCGFTQVIIMSYVFKYIRFTKKKIGRRECFKLSNKTEEVTTTKMRRKI